MLSRSDHTDFPAELLVWLSPAFPVGSFAYSHGLENEVTEGRIKNADALHDWLDALAAHGSLRNDLILLSLAYRAEGSAELLDIAELASALQPSKERSREALTQGANFRAAYLGSWTEDGRSRFAELGADTPVTLAVAVAIAAKDSKLPLLPTLEAYALGFDSNLISAAIRLGVIGQVEGQRILAAQLPGLRRIARGAEFAAEDDLGSAVFAADIASMKHETQQVRLFRS